jgi:hypothetical protein
VSRMSNRAAAGALIGSVVLGGAYLQRSDSIPAKDPASLLTEDANGYPAWVGVDLDCADVGHPVRVIGDDPHGLDRDGDGWGCEAQ